MVRGADGSVIIDTGLDNSGVDLGAKEVEKRIKSLVSSVDKLGAKFEKAAAGYASNAGEILSREFTNNTEGIVERLKALGEVKIPTDKYKKVNSELEKTDAKFQRLIDRQEKMQAMGVAHDSAQWKSLQYDIEQVGQRYEALAAKKAEMEADGSAFINGSETEEYQRLNAELEQLENALNAGATPGQKFSGVMVLLGHVVKTVADHALTLGKRLATIGFNAAASGARKAVSGIKSLVIQTRKAISGLKSFKSQAHKTDLSTSGLVKSLTSLKRLLITRIKRMFISAIFNDVREGIQQLAKHSKAFDKQISNMKNSATRLSGNIAVTLGGIISVAEPVITRIIDLLAQGVDWINQFIAALQGKSSYTSAAKGAEDYAKAADKATSSQKKLNRELYSFDELNRQGNYDNGSDSDSNSIAFDEKTVNLPTFVVDWMDRLKDAWKKSDWQGLGQVIAEGVNGVFGKLDDLISWENIGDSITRIVNGITETMNGIVDGVDWAKVGRTFGSGINTVVNTLYLFFTGIDWDAIGRALSTGFNGLVNRVDWNKLGRLFGAKINALIDLIHGFVSTFEWGKAGRAFAESVLGLVDEVKWGVLRQDFADAINGAVTMLLEFVRYFEWGKAGTDFSNGVNDLIGLVDWDSLGTMLSESMTGALDLLSGAVSGFDEKELANDLKAMFRRIDWSGIASKTWELMRTAFKKFGNFLNVLFADESTSRWDPWEKMYVPDADTTLGERIGKKIHDAFKAIPWDSIASDLWTAARTALTNAGDFITSLFDVTDADVEASGGNKALATGRKIGELIANAIGKIDWAEFGTQFSETVTSLFDTLNGFLQGIGKAGEGESKSKLQTAIEEFFGHIEWETVTSSILTFAAQFFVQLGKNLGGAILTGIKSIFTPHEIVEVGNGGTKSAVEEMAERLVGATTEAVIKEIQAQTPNVEIAIEQAAQIIMDAADSKAKGESEAEQFYSGFKNTIFDQHGQVKEDFVGVLSTIFSAGDLEAIQNGEMSAYDFVDKFSSSALIKTDDGITAMEQFYATVLGAYDTSAKGKELGTNIDDGIIKGIESKKDDVAKSLDDTPHEALRGEHSWPRWI